jgi:nicotinic acid mononucleotide adenylyltransferase
LFGGGFNPIAQHHADIAKLIWAQTGMRTFIMPCYKHRFAKNNDLIDVSHRWNMVMEVTNSPENQEMMVAFDFEVARRHDGSMYDTISLLRASNPDTEFHIVVGMDNANIIETEWHNGLALVQMCPFIVVQCTGITPKVDWFNHPPHRVLPFESVVHSKLIRKAIEEGRYDFARRHLHPRVWDYIAMGHLYGYEHANG